MARSAARKTAKTRETAVMEKSLVTPPVVVETPSPVEAPSPSPVESKVSKSKKNPELTKLCPISAARVRRHLDSMRINHAIIAADAKYQAVMSDYEKLSQEVATCEEKSKLTAMQESVTCAKEHHRALMSERVRFSNKASLVLALVCNYVLREMTQLAIKNATDAKNNNLLPWHYHVDVESLSVYSLVYSLPTFRAAYDKYKSEQDARSLKVLVDKAVSERVKELRREYKFTKKPVPTASSDTPVATSSDAVTSDDTVASNDSSSGPSFRFYATNVIHNVKSSLGVSPRVSEQVKHYTGQLIAEFIQRMANMLLLTSLSCKNKTITESLVLDTVRKLMSDRDPHWEESFEFVQSKNGLVCKRHVKYPTSGYEELNAAVSLQLVEYENLMGATVVSDSELVTDSN